VKGAARGRTNAPAFAAEILELVIAVVPKVRADLMQLGAILPLHLLAYKKPLSTAATDVLAALMGPGVVNAMGGLGVRAVGRDYFALCSELLTRAAHESELVGALRASAAQVGAPRNVHDVSFVFPDGRALGASRLLISSASYYRRLLSVQGDGEAPPALQTAEATSGVVKVDESFTFEAYEALFKQLHSAGQEPLPADDCMLLAEMDALARKMQPPRAAKRARDDEERDGEPEQQVDPTLSIATRCWAALVKGLTAENCIPLLSAVSARPGLSRAVLGRAKDLAQRVTVAVLADAAKETTGFRREWSVFLKAHPETALSFHEEARAVRSWLASSRAYTRTTKATQTGQQL
jgi:hypothetical protein